MNDPDHYDACHAYLTADLAMWASLVQPGARVLELGCGTGRVAVAMARAGARVTGLDAEPALLARASEKLPDAEWIAGDMRAFALARRDFELVAIAFNTLNVLVDADGALACVTCARDHLAPGGRLAIDIAVPAPEKLTAAVDEHVTSYTLPDGTRVRVTGSRSYDPARQRRRIALAIHRSDRAEPEHDELVTRVTFPRELALLVERAGLRVVATWGDYARTPFGAGAKQHVVVGER